MKIYNDTIQYNEQEVAYNGGWFQKESESVSIHEFINRHISKEIVENIEVTDKIFNAYVLDLVDNITTQDFFTKKTDYSIKVIEQVQVSDVLSLCCVGVIANDKIGLEDTTNQVVLLSLQDNIVSAEIINLKCEFKVKPIELISLQDFLKYAKNGTEIIWQWNDIISDNTTPWITLKHKTATWIDRNKLTTKFTDREIPNKL